MSVSKAGLAMQPWSASADSTHQQPLQQLSLSRAPPPNAPPEIIDFFASIEEEQRFLDQNPALVESAVANTGHNPFHGQTPVAYQPYNPFRQTLLITDGQPASSSSLSSGQMAANPFGGGMGATGFDASSASSSFNPQLNGLDLAVVSSQHGMGASSASSSRLAVPAAEFNPFGGTTMMAAAAAAADRNYAASNYTASSVYTAASSTSTSPENSPWALAPYRGPPATTGRIRESLNPFLLSSPAAAASTSWLPSTASSFGNSNSGNIHMNHYYQQPQQQQQQHPHQQQQQNIPNLF
ncbi:hypothetical protein SYNPS1DRAFT_30351 [Syncephalis pseudoplumigaleata]|uniref:Uncharacterized protein n=1 Tax=Syncephalis pseudoplumigaleata TaxID=1712513 RepID=A0A4P9YV61_9FUNG|nr:hypothetical protein SYNPS1DRAFT_30351 [Syncephalis pseudoplumigaleata]|eukprot:RKP23887.1 hypothetical protein SYNPS1DRAFT_30351 [Syncephalis pseudoplumigaleata]